MNIILLEPTDVLFFRDGRPMGGALAGHSAAWPLPDVTNHALHAALHRAGFEGTHQHRRGRSGTYGEQRDRRFGSLRSAGPYPVVGGDRWFFPRPADSAPAAKHSVEVTSLPVLGRSGDLPALSDRGSLPKPLRHPVGALVPPSKEGGGEPWISSLAFSHYLGGGHCADAGAPGATDFLKDADVAALEARPGIGIDDETGVAGQGLAEGQYYTAHHLRLRDGIRLGVLAAAEDKGWLDSGHPSDLLGSLFGTPRTSIVVGGEQRVCSAVRRDAPDPLPLPLGLRGEKDFHQLPDGRFAVKWVLLSPAVFPRVAAFTKDGKPQTAHCGGWLPNWVSETDGAVLLTSGPGAGKARRAGARHGLKPSAPLAARLVAAIIPKPLVVTGWALPTASDAGAGGAKSVHFAVPAGAVYYFAAESATAAAGLAAALNWHGPTAGSEIRNRRSTLLGEKGYGLGVCGTWSYHEDVPGRPQ